MDGRREWGREGMAVFVFAGLGRMCLSLVAAASLSLPLLTASLLLLCFFFFAPDRSPLVKHLQALIKLGEQNPRR